MDEKPKLWADELLAPLEAAAWAEGDMTTLTALWDIRRTLEHIFGPPAPRTYSDAEILAELETPD